jgi:hypothetical protein
MKKPAKRRRKSAGADGVSADNPNPAPVSARDAVVARIDQDFAAVAGYAELTLYRKARLIEELLRAKRRFDLREEASAIPIDTAAKREIETIRQSVGRIAGFDTNGPLGAKALRLLASAGDQWKASQAELPRGFVEPFNDARGFVEDFLRAADAMKLIVELALAAPATRQEIHLRDHWLVGAELPRIYNRTFPDAFKATPKTPTSRASNGVLFVRASRAALGLPAMPDETIRAHWRTARAAGEAV